MLDRDRPEILQPPGHPQACCTQQTLTVPPEVTAKTAQKHDYPPAAWRRSYARRTGAERGFATAKDPATNDITRGWCRLMGLAPLLLFTTPLLIVRNQRILAAWNIRQDDNARRASGNPASSAQRGPARAETAPQARPDAGRGVSQSDLLGLQQLLERLWRPNCDAPGVDTLKVKVRFTVGLNGNLLGPSGRQVTVIGREGSSLSGLAPDELRAVDSVHRAEPFAEPYYGQTIVVNFDAKEACSNR